MEQPLLFPMLRWYLPFKHLSLNLRSPCLHTFDNRVEIFVFHPLISGPINHPQLVSTISYLSLLQTNGIAGVVLRESAATVQKAAAVTQAVTSPDETYIDESHDPQLLTTINLKYPLGFLGTENQRIFIQNRKEVQPTPGPSSEI